jgi:guanylate kinase
MRETWEGRERNAALWWRKVKRRLFGRSWQKWENNIKVGVDIVLKIMDRTHLD